ncbi:hypothetical protein GJ496_006141 [Pomphorhynchus laevis]|nr:hypothetical protein GJ496_006141 [Pomphorhynchus laevis]
MYSHYNRHQQAVRYLLTLPNVSVNDEKSANSYNLTVCFISVKRNKSSFEYLHQSIASLHYGLIKANMPALFVVAFGGEYVDKIVATKFKWFKIPDLKDIVQNHDLKPNCNNSKGCIEYYHYIHVLNITSNYKSSHLLILQDDALAHSGTGSNIKWLLERRVHQIRYSKPKIVKMYTPEYYQKYPITTHDILELIAFTYMIFIICTMNGMRKDACLSICIFFVLICLFGGREIFYEKRRYFYMLFTLKPSYDASLVAVLYINPMNYVHHLINWLLRNRRDNIDIMIHRYTHKQCITDVTLEPNLFYHIGFESAVAHPRNWKLFTDIPYHLF